MGKQLQREPLSLTSIIESSQPCPRCGKSDVQETHHPGAAFMWCYHCDWHRLIEEVKREESDG